MSLTLNISPSHPSAFLKQWIFPDDMTFTEIAKRLGVTGQSVDALVNARSSLSPEMTKRIELAFGGFAELLLSPQMKYDLAKVENRVSEFVKEIESYDANYATRHDGP